MKIFLITAGAALAISASAFAQDKPDPNAAQPKGEVPMVAAPLVPADPGTPRDLAAPIGSPANPVTLGGNLTPAPLPQQAYPLCTRTLRDQCRNPGWRRESSG